MNIRDLNRKRSASSYMVAALLYIAFFASIIFMYGITLHGLSLCVLGALLALMSLTDLDERRIPNKLIIIGIITWLLSLLLALLWAQGIFPAVWDRFFSFETLGSYDNIYRIGINNVLPYDITSGFSGVGQVIAALCDGLVGGFGTGAFVLVVSILFDGLTGKKNLGGGDVKLYFMTGLFLGFANAVLNLILSCLIGAVFGIIYNNRSKFARTEALDGPSSNNNEKAFPFGPAIAVSTWITLIFGPLLTSMYLSLF